MASIESEKTSGTVIVKDFATTEVLLTYADCDPAGIVYFASWFPWMERVLSGWLYGQGLRSDQLLDKYGFATITRHAECEYLHPADHFDTIRVTMASATIGRTSLQWGFTMVRESDEVQVGRGIITWVTIDGDGKATPVPEQVHAAVKNF